MTDPIGPQRPGDLLFVGGTGRSGTHIVAELIACHSRYSLFPLEARFHVNPKGVGDLIEGRATVGEFVEKLRGFWWSRRIVGQTGPALRRAVRRGPKRRGLHLAIEAERFEAAVERFEAAADDDLHDACRRLVIDLLWPVAERQQTPGLVEMSSFNITGAPPLAALFGEARFVHTVRDGRDAGASKVAKREKRSHPRDVLEGLRWWAERIDAIEASASRLPSGALHVVGLDELVAGDRERAYTELREFCELDDEQPMREFFDQQMNAEAANRERWKAQLGRRDAAEVNQAYEQELARMEQAGYSCAPALRRALEREAA